MNSEQPGPAAKPKRTFSSELKDQYQGAGRMMARYWTVYGGWRGILTSPYFHLALVVQLVSAKYWLSSPWWDLALSIEPSFLGFSLACYALLVGLGDERFRRLIAGTSDNGRNSPFMGASATFAHFILVQALALISALLAKSFDWPICTDSVCSETELEKVMAFIAPVGWALGYFVFAYSLTLSIAAMIAILRLSTWFDRAVSNDNEIKRKQDEAKSQQVAGDAPAGGKPKA